MLSMQTLIMIGQLILGLSILVFIHELGHFLAARMFGIRVEKFYIFFDFWGKKLFSYKKGDTEYGIGWFPLGGYVKIAGMVDESMDTEKLKAPPEPWEFRSKPAWQRLIVMVAGVFMNLVLGIIMFSVMSFYYGEQYIPVNQNDPAIVAYSLGQEVGFRTGDTLLKINNTNFNELRKFEDIYSFNLLLSDNATVTVLRNGKKVVIKIDPNFLNKITDQGIQKFLDQGFSFIVKEVMPGSNADKGGLKANDKIIALNDTTIHYYYQLIDAFHKHSGYPVKLTILRNNKDTVISPNVQVANNGTIGFYADMNVHYAVQKYGFLESFKVGNAKSWRMLKENTIGFVKIFKGEVDPRNALQGPISIAKKIYGGVWIWEKFWSITALLSLILAFMNLLPIPALDGGHVITILIEVVTGKPLRTKVLEVIQTIGMILLFALMAFAIFNDIFQNFFK
jgi:regulator of sigma E protease